MRFPGGKNQVVKRLINLVPPHDRYVEAFLGSGPILRRKVLAKEDIGIDMSDAVIQAFGVRAGVRLVCGDALEVLPTLGLQERDLVYCDPPYLRATRRSKRRLYKYDLGEAGHEALIDLVRSLRCQVMISGYPSALYASALADWRQLQFGGTSHRGRTVECVWLNFEPGLLHDPSVLGEDWSTRLAFRRRRQRWCERFESLGLPFQQSILLALSHSFHKRLTPAQRSTFALQLPLKEEISHVRPDHRAPAVARAKRNTSVVRPTVIDLFAGAGFFGHAFAAEGFRVETSFEADAAASEVNALNSRAEVRLCDLRDVRPFGRADVIIAGPPCQGFSSLGPRLKRDPRNNLCLLVPKWAEVVRPKLVVVENVPQFLLSEPWKIMASEFRTLGFECAHWVLNAKHYGVAQNRKRSITVFARGLLPDISAEPKELGRTVRDAFAGLPGFPDRSAFHFTLPQSEATLRRIRLVPAGGDLRDVFAIDPELTPPSWRRAKDKVGAIWGRLPWDGHSNTIRTGFIHPSRGRFLHPEEDRPISFREAARLQSVPDEFQFQGFAEHVARHIGNGVPIGLGRMIARAVAAAL
ncbi:MAG: DNA cytosine methyltransferase [Verrucomicrobia bacterium]|nr:DNA cytosine methyltransferase [Verrucomicrobiota bacterium]